MIQRRLAAVDAQTYWMSAAIPSDQFLLYAFEGGSVTVDAALREIRRRAAVCAELTLRIVETQFWTYPVWMPREVGPDQFVVHDPDGGTWAGCLAAVTALAQKQLDPRVMTWRLHVFPAVEGVPGAGRCATVAVMQICHALGDGVRSSALAGRLFGRAGGVPAVAVPRYHAAGFVRQVFSAGHTHRRLVRETAAGLVPPGAEPCPVLSINQRPSGPRQVRMVICERGQLPGPTITVGVLAAVSTALSGHLRELGDDPARLGAEIPMAKSGPRLAHNHFSNVGVGLYPSTEFGLRARRIAADLYRCRRRAAHPAMRAQEMAFAAMPAGLLRWGVAQFDPDVRSPTVTGNTVVSSVNRGAKDLRFGAGSVLFTAGFPGLSPMMGVTHGVHGIGGTIAVSVHAAESAIGDFGAYLARLEQALRQPERVRRLPPPSR
ncbi:MAG: DUF1298 domain-containing protein [Mycobacterium sp.]|nr:DUF1298 domain-containing protein [Mycobacterium sp.]